MKTNKKLLLLALATLTCATNVFGMKKKVEPLKAKNIGSEVLLKKFHGLISKKIDPIFVNQQKENMEKIRCIIAKNPGIENIKFNGCYPLHSACKSGDLEKVKFFAQNRNYELDSLSKETWFVRNSKRGPYISRGKKVSTNFQQTPLFIAVLNEFNEIIEYLISLGADPKVKCQQGKLTISAYGLVKTIQKIKDPYYVTTVKHNDTIIDPCTGGKTTYLLPDNQQERTVENFTEIQREKLKELQGALERNKKILVLLTPNPNSSNKENS